MADELKIAVHLCVTGDRFETDDSAWFETRQTLFALAFPLKRPVDQPVFHWQCLTAATAFARDGD